MSDGNYDQKPTVLNLAVVAGDELNTDITLTIGCGGTAAFSLEGYTVSGEIRSLVTGGTVSTLAMNITNVAGGVFNLAVPETLSASLPRGSYDLRVRWTAPGNIERTIYGGVFEVRR